MIVQTAVEYSKTEDAAKDAEARLQALRVANDLMRTELMILKDQDDAYVNDLLEELGVDLNGLAKKLEREARGRVEAEENTDDPLTQGRGNC